MQNVSLIQADELQESIREIIREELKNYSFEANKPKGEELITAKEFMSRLDISNPTFFRWKESGKVPVKKLGGKLFVYWNEFLQKKDDSNDVENLLEK
jgi:predicted DNA-binding transcriptional regulator AlpA